MIKYISIGLLLLTFNLLSCTKDKAIKEVVAAPSDCLDTIKFSTQLLPVLTDQCFSCHSNGTSPSLTGHADVSEHANHILEAIKGEGAQLMPQGGPKLNDSFIKQFSCWISQGKKNN